GALLAAESLHGPSVDWFALSPLIANQLIVAGNLQLVAEALVSLATVITIAERSGRTDLSSRLRASREGIRRTGVTVAIVGEFKKGKSNLVNALVNADVCPSDPVFATVVPISVGHAETASVGVELLRGAPEPPSEQAYTIAQVGELASEDGNLDNRR